MDDVSVVIPAYRAAGTIERALRSVASQTRLPREVVIVDDGSEDGTLERAKALESEMAPVSLKLFRQDNAGPGAARNRAIAESSGAILAFLDADDEWLPKKLEQSLRHLASGNVALVAHNITVQDGNATQEFDCAQHLREGTDAFVALFKRGFISTATVVCRRDAVEAAGGFDPTLRSGQDYELWLSIARRDPRRIVVLDDVLTRYHVMPGSVSSHLELRRRASLTIAKRHATGLRNRTVCPACILTKRVLIIAAECTISHVRRGAGLSAARVLALLPFDLASALWRLWQPAPDGRPTAGKQT